MEELKVFCRDRCQGAATVERKDGRAEIAVSMNDPADGLYRAILLGEQGQLPLGVMEPHHGTLILRRKPYLRDVEQLGRLRNIQATCSFTFQRKESWKKTDRPAELVTNRFLKDRLLHHQTAWWKKSGDILHLALPLDEEHAFPVEALFCFAKLELVDGKRCVVYTFDHGETPR